MKRIYAVFFLLISANAAFTQALFNNNGADIYVKDGGFMIVKSGPLHNNQIAGVGFIDNLGTVVVEGDITNDGPITADGDTIRLTGNWINNNTYTGNNSWVELNGGAQQITGSAVTTFNNLNLLGGNTVKRQTINAVTSGTLQLNDAELATDVNEMLVTNPGPNTISRNNGFVSSVNTGKLSRATNSTSTYFFPVGSPSYNNPPSIFRPVEYAPVASLPNTYGAMVVKGDATNDGYNVNTTDDILCAVNPNFYHQLYHTVGNDAASLKMFFDPSADGSWSDQAHWDLPNRWNYQGVSTPGSSLGFSTVLVNGINDFLPEPFALARKKFTVDAGPTVTIAQGQSTAFNPVIGTGSISNITWSPSSTLSCANCETPVANPAITGYYTISVTDDAGCTASDSLLVNVTTSILLIPTAFSPNKDGVNDFFRALNKDLAKYTLQVYNRWGEMVFETTDPLEGWNGIYKGIEQELGVYVWSCQYSFNGAAKSETAKGNVTLMR
ncbi:MAG: gliding motility-associated C-terminal domain-containing protein [Bacteroidota bacterium]